jgi:hypothetical protein
MCVLPGQAKKHTHAYIYLCMYVVYMYVSMHVLFASARHINVRMHIFMHVCIEFDVYMHVSTHVLFAKARHNHTHVHVFMHARMHVSLACTYAHTCIPKKMVKTHG